MTKETGRGENTTKMSITFATYPGFCLLVSYRPVRYAARAMVTAAHKHSAEKIVEAFGGNLPQRQFPLQVYTRKPAILITKRSKVRLPPPTHPTVSFGLICDRPEGYCHQEGNVQCIESGRLSKRQSPTTRSAACKISSNEDTTMVTPAMIDTSSLQVPLLRE